MSAVSDPSLYTRCLLGNNDVFHSVTDFLDFKGLSTILAVNRTTRDYFAEGFHHEVGLAAVPQKVDKALKRFPNARSLTIKATLTACTIELPGDSGPINKIVSLTICHLDRSYDPDHGIYPYRSLRNLLDRSPELASVTVSVRMSGEALQVFSRVRNLTEIDLSRCFWSDAFRNYGWLAKLHSLRKIAFPPCIDKTAILSSNREITDLDLGNTYDSDSVSRTIATHLPQLRHLKMSLDRSYMWTDEEFARLKGVPLESLRLTEFAAQCAPAQTLMALRDFSHLTHLSAAVAKLDAEAFTALAETPTITSLSLERCQNTDEELLNLQRMGKLVFLNLLNSKVRFRTIKAIVLAHREHLSFLAISFPVGKDDLVYLLDTAKKLNTLHCTLTDFTYYSQDDEETEEQRKYREETVKYVNDVNTTLLNRRIYVHPYEQFSLELSSH